MSSENDSTVWSAVVGAVALILGWLFHRTNTANSIAVKVSEKLSEYYMKREEVRADIKEAREDLRRDVSLAVTPLNDRLMKIEMSINKLTDELIKK